MGTNGKRVVLYSKEFMNVGEILGNNSLLDGALNGGLSYLVMKLVLPVINRFTFLSPSLSAPFPSI